MHWRWAVGWGISCRELCLSTSKEKRRHKSCGTFLNIRIKMSWFNTQRLWLTDTSRTWLTAPFCLRYMLDLDYSALSSVFSGPAANWRLSCLVLRLYSRGWKLRISSKMFYPSKTLWPNLVFSSERIKSFDSLAIMAAESEIVRISRHTPQWIDEVNSEAAHSFSKRLWRHFGLLTLTVIHAYIHWWLIRSSWFSILPKDT